VRIVIVQRWRWQPGYGGWGRSERSRLTAALIVGMTYVVDVRDPLTEGSLEPFP
jgi:hypothetical protein